MSCPFCGSGNQAKFTAELLIHFSGLKNLDKPAVSVFRSFWSAYIAATLALPFLRRNWRRFRRKVE
jgi:hypothetical protein